MDATSAVEETAATVAADLLGEGVVVLPRSAANRRVKEAGEFEAIGHEAIEAGFGAEGWAYARHLYFHPDRVAEEAGAAVEESEKAGRLLVAHEEVLERIAPSTVDGGEVGWEEGAFAGTVRDAFRERGWAVEAVDRGPIRRTLYYRPLYDLFEEHHPNGRYPFSARDLCSLYVARSIEAAVDGES